MNYSPGRSIRIRCIISKRDKIIEGVFSLFIYALFSGFLIGAITDNIFIGLLFGVALWAWRNSLGPYLSINFNKGSYAFIRPVSVEGNDSFPGVELRTTYEEKAWTSQILVGGHPVMKNVSLNSEEESREELKSAFNFLTSEIRRAVRAAGDACEQ